jgi:hypothetical protein
MGSSQEVGLRQFLKDREEKRQLLFQVLPAFELWDFPTATVGIPDKSLVVKSITPDFGHAKLL